MSLFISTAKIYLKGLEEPSFFRAAMMAGTALSIQQGNLQGLVSAITFQAFSFLELLYKNQTTQTTIKDSWVEPEQMMQLAKQELLCQQKVIDKTLKYQSYQDFINERIHD